MPKLPKLFIADKRWQDALISACIGSNTTALIAAGQSANLIPRTILLTPPTLGGLACIASEIAHNGLEFSGQGQLLGTISLFLNYMLPEYFADFFDGDIRKASMLMSLILALLSLLLAASMTPQPKPVPAAPTPPLQKTKFHKQKPQPELTRKEITSTDSQDPFVKVVALIDQTKSKVNSQYELLVEKGNCLLGKIELSQKYLDSNNCKVEERKRLGMARSNQAKISFIKEKLNVHKVTLTSWSRQLDQMPSSGSDLESHSSMLQQGQALLTSLSGSLGSLHDTEQNLMQQQQTVQKGIEAWKKKHPADSEDESKSSLDSISLRLG